MTTLHLPIEVEAKLTLLAEKKQKSKIDIIKEALDYFFNKEESERDSYQLGEEYFGQYGSGNGALSVSYKQKLKENIHAKIDSR